MGNESANFPPFLIIAGLLTLALVVSYFWRKSSLFNQKNQWSSAASCALLWAGVALIFSIVYMGYRGDFANLFNAFRIGIFESFRIGMVGFDQLFSLVLVPVIAILGALFGACFTWLKANNKASGSPLQRGLIGVGVGLILPIILTVIGVILFMLNNKIGLQAVFHAEYGALILIIWGIILVTIAVACLILGLMTPKHLLTNKI
jgi:hypothetical protein